MSNSSSFNLQIKQGFTPYQSSQERQLSQISLFSKLNLNSQISLDEPIRMCNKQSSSDLLSMRSRKRKGSVQMQLKQSIRGGNNAFLKYSLVASSSVHPSDLNINQDNEYQIDDHHKDLSERSCPVGYPNNDSPQNTVQKEKELDNNEDLRGRFHKTKNLLRNMSTYFHRYLNHNKRATSYIKRYFDKHFKGQEQVFQQFQEWVRRLSMNNFQQYQQVWTTPHKFQSLYRQLSYHYYIKQAYCDIYKSRLQKQTKAIAIRYLHQFIQGLQHPSVFHKFK